MASVVSIPYYATPIDTYALKRVLEDHLLSTVEGMLEDYQATVATWDNQPEFDFIIATESGDFTAVVGTNDQIYEWVNEGTGQAGGNRSDWYPIPSAPTGVAYQSHFTAKTRPGMLQSRAGGKSGPVDTVRHQVHHPGITPRHFDQTITEKWQAYLNKNGQKTLDSFYESQSRLLIRGRR